MSLQHTDKIVGVMSGSSLDGLDIALCHIGTDGKNWHYHIEKATTVTYENSWKQQLAHAHLLSGLELTKLNSQFGTFIGKTVRHFLDEHHLSADYVASHGHTVFHQPEKGFTLQIGHGGALAAAAQLPVVCDFRTTDVALGGQGAPLVPIGDQLLFADFDYCLNLGGIANMTQQKYLTAFDITACNILLNYVSEKLGQPYDKDGVWAASGVVQPDLLAQLNTFPFLDKKAPKSLGKEHITAFFLPILENSEHNLYDQLATISEHIALQIARMLPHTGKLLATGGGAFNKHLVQKIQHYLNTKNIQVIVPDSLTVAFKEALIFALLGALRWQNSDNCLAQVTGAWRNNCGGAIYWG
jgi:anhydro-N-acetylmuramic acid kinase